MAKEFLSQKGIQYTEYDVAQNREARQEMVKKSGQMGVPVITINGDVVVGFNKAHLEHLLGLAAEGPEKK